MVKPLSVLQGEIWLCGLDPTIGKEIQKTRPCLVVSPDSMNRFLYTVTAVPLTSGSRPAGFRVSVEFKAKSGLLLCDQVRTLDKARLIKRMGTINSEALRETLAVLREMFSDS